jgi:hypothetical protein
VEQSVNPVAVNPVVSSAAPVVQAPANLVCPKCHVVVRPTDYFCYNCGQEIQEKPVRVSVVDQIAVYVGSVVLPPMGLVWGVRYYRKKGRQPKMVGLIAILLTLVSLVVVAITSVQLMNTVTEQVNQRMENLQAL